jgi:uncharacterized protein (DUF111 family)
MTFSHADEHLDDNMLLVQANIDDMNPEWCSYTADRLFAAGANDVYWIPILMKKGRPGLMLNVLIDKGGLAAVEDVIFRETTTLGIRYMKAVCHRLGRQSTKVSTPWGDISVKAGYRDGEMVQYSPEFSECEEAARRHGVPLKKVYDEVRRAFMEMQER